MNERNWVGWGAFLAAVAVGLGAFGAHGLEGKIPDARFDAFEVGVRYHLVHAIALVLVGILASRWGGRLVMWAGVLLAAGIVLFSGGIYVWSLSGVRAIVHIVPIGGLSFLAGWLVLAVAAMRRGRSGPE